MIHPFDRARHLLREVTLSDVRGVVHGALGLSLHARLPGARRGDWVQVDKRDGTSLSAEVVAFHGEDVVLMPLGDTHGIGPDDPVKILADAISMPMGDAVLGRVLDGLGRPIDGGPTIDGVPYRIKRAAPRAVDRPRIDRVMATTVRSIDALCTLGVGQRVGLFAPAGVGKTTLLGQIARGADADVVVVALIGERGHELGGWLEHLSSDGRKRTVVVCATGDEAPLLRVKSAHTATAIAEYFREQHKHVLLIVDSLTRLVRAGRDVGLSAGEPALRRGFPPSAFAELPPLVERAGCSERGAITAIYSILVEGNDLDEPVSDEARGLLDGHLVLSRALAERGRYPALDVPRSLSRAMHHLVSDAHRKAAQALRTLIGHAENKHDLVTLGAYTRGQDPLLDRALDKQAAIEAFLVQPQAHREALDQTVRELSRLVR